MHVTALQGKRNIPAGAAGHGFAQQVAMPRLLCDDLSQIITVKVMLWCLTSPLLVSSLIMPHKSCFA